MEGWAGGLQLSKQFRQALITAGFNITEPWQADVLIAHSTACYDLPIKSPINLFFLIDPPYWPGKSIFNRAVEKKRIDSKMTNQAGGWTAVLKKTVWEGLYIFKKPKYTPLALKNNPSLDFLGPLKSKQVVLVRNKDDAFCSPDIQVALSGFPNVRYAVVPGGHDDYMTNPQPYIDLLYKAI